MCGIFMIFMILNKLNNITFSVGDITFKCDVRSFASHHASQSHGRTYMYSFEYRHSANPWPSWMGSLHGYEIEPVFGQPFNPMLKYSDLDREVSAKVMDYFTTFANTGYVSVLLYCFLSFVFFKY
jgi:carboxylesterase type B